MMKVLTGALSVALALMLCYALVVTILVLITLVARQGSQEAPPLVVGLSCRPGTHAVVQTRLWDAS